MAMAGSVVTKDMEENHVYAGVPAKDVTDVLGTQFGTVSPEVRRQKMEGYLEQFISVFRPRRNRIRIVDTIDGTQKEYSQFSLTERIYLKNLYPEEVDFMRFLRPTKAKFLPFSERDWIGRYLSSMGSEPGETDCRDETLR